MLYLLCKTSATAVTLYKKLILDFDSDIDGTHAIMKTTGNIGQVLLCWIERNKYHVYS